MHTTPHSLLQRLRTAPEQAAWEKFVAVYTPLFLVWTRRLGLREHDAADLIQDLFTILVEKLPQFDYDASKSFRGWLRTILLNRWRNLLRQKARENLQPGHDLLDAVPAPEEVPAFEEAEYRQFVIQRGLGLLEAEFPPATWQACWRYVVLGRPPAEVAAELNLSVNAVYLAKSRVLRRLREELVGLLD